MIEKFRGISLKKLKNMQKTTTKKQTHTPKN